MITRILALLLLAWACLGLASPSWALLNDDRYDGNIFALYGSNGGVVPPRMTLEASLQREMPAIVVYYIDDSRDCKEYAAVIGNLQVRYGLGINFLAYAVDSLDLQDPTGTGRYFTGQVPQTLVFDAKGQITYQSVGNRPIAEVENAIRALFDLQPVSSDNRQAQSFNEVQTGFRAPTLSRRKTAQPLNAHE